MKTTITDRSGLGCKFENGKFVFRLFSSHASSIALYIFDEYEDPNPRIESMKFTEDGIWEYSTNDDLWNKFYAYSLVFPDNEGKKVENTDYLIADPFSRYVVTINNHLQHARTLILKEEPFKWSDRDFYPPSDPRDLIIYECHIKDMVAHPSANTYVQGIYNDFIQAETGGMTHLKKLGVNAVEFLPLQKFAYYEPPFDHMTETGVRNTWNPYSINHWGYMTSFHFVPETLYASDGSFKHSDISGHNANAHREVKSMVNRLHGEGISVIMDVVYNHASHYDLNPLKYTAKDHYFRLDDAGNYVNDSWTGNDISTAAKHSRELILESLIHWVKEYHIDGFRFDLAGLIDWETVEMISAELKNVKPNIILIAEPWGGAYKPDGFSDRGWASWNDRMRNNFKGYDPEHDKGFIFGNFNPHVNRFAIENGFRGSLKDHEHGLFRSSRHALNYLESHDGYTLADYIRIVLEPEILNTEIKDIEDHTTLNEEQMRICRLAALSLFVSQGITMIHEGQEYGRSKVIRHTDVKDSRAGYIDRDTYNKDNETNWINFEHISLNEELFNYYRGLIELRLNAPALRKAASDEINFKVYQDPLHVTFSLEGHGTNDKYDYFVSINTNPHQDHEIILPEGYWELLVDDQQAGSNTIKSVESSYMVKACTGTVLRKLRVNKA
ncbi:pullulanase [Balneola sp. MJW-20]|uniref:alpha-amylase family glycosyl hydrolase n=1 Tax=Gracilimonas aurantiaca TaxID=3234185 RepID=UPI0034653972